MEDRRLPPGNQWDRCGGGSPICCPCAAHVGGPLSWMFPQSLCSSSHKGGVVQGDPSLTGALLPLNLSKQATMFQTIQQSCAETSTHHPPLTTSGGREEEALGDLTPSWLYVLSREARVGRGPSALPKPGSPGSQSTGGSLHKQWWLLGRSASLQRAATVDLPMDH